MSRAARALGALAAACLRLASARAEDAPVGVLVRPLLGVGVALSDTGVGPSAQLGVRVAPVVVRLSLDARRGSGTNEHAFLRLAGHAGLLVLDHGAWALLAGGHGGTMAYGPGIGDDAAASWVAGPELGVLLGPARPLGRLLVEAELLLSDGPGSPPGHPSERAAPPRFVVSLVASL